MDPASDITVESRALTVACSVLFRKPPDWNKYRPVLSALADVLFPAVEPQAQARERMAWFLQQKGSDHLQDEIIRSIETLLVPGLQKELALLFELLTSRAFLLAMGGKSPWAGRPPFVKTFLEMTTGEREALLVCWSGSPLGICRKAFKSFKGIVLTTLFIAPGKEGTANPLGVSIGYPGPVSKEERPPVSAAKLDSEKVLQAATLDLSQVSFKTVAELRELLMEQGYSLVEAKEEDGDADIVIQCDAVIVGSGAGGGVTAGVLAEAGMKVVVLEKGSYIPVSELGLQEGEALGSLYERGCFLCTDDAAVNMLAGATVGGGTRVNWCASFRTPDHVRREWAMEHGRPEFLSERYERAMDRVCQRINVNASLERHSRHNTALQKGLQSLGVHCAEIPRNVVGQHQCGSCCWGCPAGEKQDMTATFLADAARAGAKILAGVHAERILTRPALLPEGGRTREAFGVLATDFVLKGGGVGGNKWHIAVRAPVVVSSAGSLHSPALLLRSDIDVNGNVGRNLRLHPGTLITGVFEEKPEDEGRGSIRMWEDAPMTIFSRELADWEGSGYGAIVTCPSAHMALYAQMPWNSGESFKLLAAEVPNHSPVLIITRDKGSGRVRLDANGQPQLHYWPCRLDSDNIIKGMELGIRAMLAAGAHTVCTLQMGPAGRFVAERDLEGNLLNIKALEHYLQKVKIEGLQRNRTGVFSAHQMGTCRMGEDDTSSVCDGNGLCWHVAGLYLADASVFPTPSGVNPMVTVESISYMTAEGIATRFKEAKKLATA